MQSRSSRVQIQDLNERLIALEKEIEDLKNDNIILENRLEVLKFLVTCHDELLVYFMGTDNDTTEGA